MCVYVYWWVLYSYPASSWGVPFWKQHGDLDIPSIKKKKQLQAFVLSRLNGTICLSCFEIEKLADFDDFSCYVDYGHVCSVKAPSISTPHVSHHRNKILDLPISCIPSPKITGWKQPVIGRQFISDFPVLLSVDSMPSSSSEKPRGDDPCVFFFRCFSLDNDD